MSLLLAFLCINLLSLMLWGLYRITKIPEWVDLGWGIFLLGSYLLQHGEGEFYLPLVALLSVWWLRISLHVLQRIRSGHADGRYQGLKDYWGESFEKKFLGFYLLQSTGAFFLVLPLRVIEDAGLYSDVILAIMALCWLLEVLADAQLSRFKSSTSRGVMDRGLWRYSRHPNYFFELCLWSGLVLLALPFDWGFLSLLSLGLMAYLILKVTGIAPMERRAQRMKGQQWLDYKSRTSMLIPFFPKSKNP